MSATPEAAKPAKKKKSKGNAAGDRKSKAKKTKKLAAAELTLTQKYEQVRLMQLEREKKKKEDEQDVNKRRLEEAKRVLQAEREREAAKQTKAASTSSASMSSDATKLAPAPVSSEPSPKRPSSFAVKRKLGDSDSASASQDASDLPPVKRQRLDDVALPTGTTELSVAAKPTPTTSNVFVGALNEATREGDLEEHFAKFGRITSIRLVPHKRCAFIVFATVEDAAKAIAALDGKEIDGCRVRVSEALPPRRSGGGRGAFRGGAGLYEGSHGVYGAAGQEPSASDTLRGSGERLALQYGDM